MWNLLRIWDCRPFSVLKTLTSYRPYSQSVYFIRLIGQPRNTILCYEADNKNTIVRQFTRCSSVLGCIPLSERGAKIKNQARFLCFTNFIYKILPKSLMACKPAFYIFHTSHLRYTVLWGAVFLYRSRTDFALFCPNETYTYTSAVFHNFARQIPAALIQYSGRSKQAPPLHNKL